MKISTLLYIGCSMFLLLDTGCKKQEEVDIDTEKECLKGTWKLGEYNVSQYDNTTGAKLLSTSKSDMGTLEFIVAPNVGDQVFNILIFDKAASDTYIPGFFLNHFADKTTTGGVAVYWDADPESKRLGLWTIEAGGSWWEQADCTGDKKNHTITSVVISKAGNTRTFYEYKLKR